MLPGGVDRQSHEGRPQRRGPPDRASLLALCQELDGEVTTNAGEKDSEQALMVNEEAGESSMTQRTVKEGRTQAQDTTVSLNVVINSTTILHCDLQENQENTPPLPNHIKPKFTHSRHSILSHQNNPPPPPQRDRHLGSNHTRRS
jgi:hypothetical protein